MPIARSFSLTCGLWMISPVRKTRAIGKPLARLVGVVDGAIDAVAEAEFAREVDGQPARRDSVKSSALIRSTSVAVIVLGQHAGDGMLQVEAFAEDEGRQQLGSTRHRTAER